MEGAMILAIAILALCALSLAHATVAAGVAVVALPVFACRAIFTTIHDIRNVE